MFPRRSGATLTSLVGVGLVTVASGLAACGSDVVPAEPSGSGGGGGGDDGSATSNASSSGAGDLVGTSCEIEGSLRCSDAEDGTFLVCRTGRYEQLGACDADEACQNVQGADSVACGEVFLGVAGTPCVAAATAVCDLAREIVLGCEAGSWVDAQHCAPVACGFVPPAPGTLCSGMACENCGYTLGDRCSFPPGTVNCSTDGAAVVACTGGTVTLAEDCGIDGLSCQLNGNIIECL